MNKQQLQNLSNFIGNKKELKFQLKLVWSLDSGNILEWEYSTDKYVYNYWKDRAAFVYLLTSTITTNSQKPNLQLEKAKLNKSISVSESVLAHPLCGRIPIIQPTCTFFPYTQALNFCSTELHEARAGNCRSQHNSDPSVYILCSVVLITLGLSLNQNKTRKQQKSVNLMCSFTAFLYALSKKHTNVGNFSTKTRREGRKRQS